MTPSYREEIVKEFKAKLDHQVRIQKEVLGGKIDGTFIEAITEDCSLSLASLESRLREEWAGETEKIISEHNARILNEFQLQGKPDMPMIAYDERVCLIPAMDKATKETLALLQPQETKSPSESETSN